MKRYIAIAIIALSLFVSGCNDDKDKQANNPGGSSNVAATTVSGPSIMVLVGLLGLVGMSRNFRE